jgi:hypothetical protein
MSPTPEPQLTPEERARLQKGVALFNDGLYFECHDVLEDLWSGIRGPSRDFFQGLIQVAVGYYHLGNGKREGARSMFGRALLRFSAYPPRYFGFDLAAQRDDLRARVERLEAAPDGPDAAAAPARWHFD